MDHLALDHLPPLPADRTVGIGCIGAGFIMADCHIVAYRAAGLNLGESRAAPVTGWYGGIDAPSLLAEAPGRDGDGT